MTAKSEARAGERASRFVLPLALASVMLALSGCSPSPEIPDELADFCSRATPVVSGLEDPEVNGSLGLYGDAPDFSENISLYRSAWSVLLANAIDSPLSKLDPDSIAAFFSEELRGTSQHGVAEGLSDLAARSLAARALGAFADGAEMDVGDIFEQFRSDARYYEGGVDSTDLVIRSLVATSSSIPQPVQEGIMASVDDALDSTGAPEILERGIPRLLSFVEIADGTELQDQRDAIAVRVTEWTQAIANGGADAISIGALADLSELSSALGMSPPDLPRHFGQEFELASGFLSATGQGGRGDAQMTYYGVRAGIVDTAAVGEGLEVGATPDGWLSTVTSPSLDGTFRARAINDLCGAAQPPIANVLSAWADELTFDARSAAQWCYLYSLEPLRGGDLKAAREAIGVDRAWDSAADVLSGAFASEASRLCGLESPGRTSRAPVTESIQAASALALLSDGDVEETGHAFDDFRTGEFFSWSAQSETPDLISTSIGVTFTSERGIDPTALLEGAGSGVAGAAVDDKLDPQLMTPLEIVSVASALSRSGEARLICIVL